MRPPTPYVEDTFRKFERLPPWQPSKKGKSSGMDRCSSYPEGWFWAQRVAFGSIEYWVGDVRKVKERLVINPGIANAKDFSGTPLLHYAYPKDIEIARLLLENGAKVNQRDVFNIGLLSYAVLGGEIEFVKLCIEFGWDVNETVNDNSVIYLAKKAGYEEIGKLLASNGAHLTWEEAIKLGDLQEVHRFISNDATLVTSNVKTGKTALKFAVKQKTALKFAFQQNQSDIARLLLENGAKVNENKLLCKAAKEGMLEFVKIFLEFGWNRQETYYGKTALKLAREAGYEEIEKLLAINGAHFTLKEAIELGDLEEVHRFISNDAALVTSNVQGGKTALEFAFEENQTDIARLLLENGAKVNENKLLCKAADRGMFEFVQIFLEFGWNRQERMEKWLHDWAGNEAGNNRTALELAFARNRTDIARLLLENGAEVNESKLLCRAANEGMLEFVKLFLEFGWNRQETFEGKTALKLARIGGHGEVAKLLSKHGANLSVFECIESDDVDSLTEVVSKDPVLSNKEIRMWGGWRDNWREGYWREEEWYYDKIYTALQLAYERGNLEMVRVLLMNGAKLDQNHLLCKAVKDGKLDFVGVLLQFGWDASERLDDRSALYFARKASDESHELDWSRDRPGDGSHPTKGSYQRIIQVLLEHGATLSIFEAIHLADLKQVTEMLSKDSSLANAKQMGFGSSPLHDAFDLDYLDIARVLLEHDADVNQHKLLCKAVESGKLEFVKIFFDFGWNPNETLEKTPALSRALANGRQEIAEVLLEHGANAQIIEESVAEKLISDQRQDLLCLLAKHGVDFSHLPGYLDLMTDGVDYKNIISEEYKRPLATYCNHKIVSVGPWSVDNLPTSVTLEMAWAFFEDTDDPDPDSKFDENTWAVVKRTHFAKLVDATDDGKDTGDTLFVLKLQSGDSMVQEHKFGTGHLQRSDMLMPTSKHSTTITFQPEANKEYSVDIEAMGYYFGYYISYCDMWSSPTSNTLSPRELLRSAIQKGLLNSVSFLIKKFDFDLGFLSKSLAIACQKRQGDIVEILLRETEADPDYEWRKGRSARSASKDKATGSWIDLHDCLRADEAEKKQLLPNVIHTLVQYPAYVEAFKEFFFKNPNVVRWKDKENRTVRQMACAECRNVTLFMGRYELEDTARYESATCQVKYAWDWLDEKAVAMKFIMEKHHFDSEVKVRRNENGQPRFSVEYVARDLAHYSVETNEIYRDACKLWSTFGKHQIPDYCIVLERGDRSLHEVMSAENLVRKPLDVRAVLLSLCNGLIYLHQQGFVHGDVKPRNFLRLGGNVWKLIDFDACVRIGEMIGLKLSTAYLPPEMIKIVETVTDQGTTIETIQAITPGSGSAGSDFVEASESFDVWAFGITMYFLLTGQSFFHCDEQDNLVDLSVLAHLTDGYIQRRLEVVKDVNARVLLSSILKVDPKERPSMKLIQQDIYFNPSDTPQGRRAQTLGKRQTVENEATIRTATSPSNELALSGQAVDDDFETYLKFASDTSFFDLKDQDKDWNDKLLHSEVQALSFEHLKAVGTKPSLIDGDTIFKKHFLRHKLCEIGPDLFMGCLVKFFELYEIMDEAEHICEKIKANLVRDVKGLKGIFVKLFVRGKGLNDIVRGTLFCDSINQFQFVAEQLQANFNVYIKPPKNEPGGWPVPKMLVWSKRRSIDGRCMTVELQFSTVYLHLAKHVSSSHLVYEFMRVSTGYLSERMKDAKFQKFLSRLNQDYFDTRGFVKEEEEEEEQVQLGSFEILSTPPTTEESVSDTRVQSTGLVVSGLVCCHGRKFGFIAPEGYMKQFSPSSFVVDNCLTLLSKHSYWSEESYELEEKVVEFIVSFNGRGAIVAGIGTEACVGGALAVEGGGTRCSVNLSRSIFAVRRNGVEVESKKKLLENQEQAILRFEIGHGTVAVSFTSTINDGKALVEEERREIEMSTNGKFHLYMRGPAGVHDIKYHSVDILEANDVSQATTADQVIANNDAPSAVAVADVGSGSSKMQKMNPLAVFRKSKSNVKAAK